MHADTASQYGTGDWPIDDNVVRDTGKRVTIPVERIGPEAIASFAVPTEHREQSAIFQAFQARAKLAASVPFQPAALAVKD